MSNMQQAYSFARLASNIFSADLLSTLKQGHDLLLREIR